MERRKVSNKFYLSQHKVYNRQVNTFGCDYPFTFRHLNSWYDEKYLLNLSKYSILK